MFLWMKCLMSAGLTLTCTCTTATWPQVVPLAVWLEASLPAPVCFSFPPQAFTFTVLLPCCVYFFFSFLCSFLFYFRNQRCSILPCKSSVSHRHALPPSFPHPCPLSIPTLPHFLISTLGCKKRFQILTRVLVWSNYSAWNAAPSAVRRNNLGAGRSHCNTRWINSAAILILLILFVCVFQMDKRRGGLVQTSTSVDLSFTWLSWRQSASLGTWLVGNWFFWVG